MINGALALANPAEKLDITKGFLDLWINGRGYSAEKVFGKDYAEFGRVKPTATVTGDRSQMRFWVQKSSGPVLFNHCDASGRKFLCEIKTKYDYPARDVSIPVDYIDLGKLIAKPIVLPNRGLVFPGSEQTRPDRWYDHQYSQGRIDYS
jgi:hypothetical protein